MKVNSRFPVSYIEISREAYRHNLSFIRSLIGHRTIFSSVIKANAYGHNISAFVPMAYEEGVRYFSVFNTEEAWECLQAIQRLTERKRPPIHIMIMGQCEGDGLAWAIENGVEFFVYDFARLRDAVNASKKVGRKAKIHIEVETGLNRTGYEFSDLQKMVDFLEEHRAHFEVIGLCTHYAGAESIANYYRIQQQYKNYQRALRYLKSRAFKVRRRHVLCSAGIVNYNKMKMDLVRVGVLQYGFWPTPETKVSYLTQLEEHHSISPMDEQGHSYIHRLMTWKSKIMAVKNVKKGEFIGYGTSFMADRPMKIATVPVGYGYGYSRGLSNQGIILVKGKRCSVVGLVNMNVLMADVTHIPSVEKNDEVILIGEEGDQEISVGSFSELSNQLNYEMLSRLPADIPRIIVDE